MQAGSVPSGSHLQTFATFCDSSQWRRYGRAYEECYKSGHFWRFETSRNVVSYDRRGASW
jgi:hypothetical protein